MDQNPTATRSHRVVTHAPTGGETPKTCKTDIGHNPSDMLGEHAMSTIETTTRFTVDSYRSLDKPGKAAVRAELARKRDEALRSGEFQDAMDLQGHLDAIKALGPNAPTPVDMPQIVADRIATYRFAAELLETGQNVPKGVEKDNVDFSNLPVGMPDKDIAVTLAEKAGTRASKSNDIATVIREALAETGATFMKVSEIGNWAKSETGGSRNVSHGAINQCLSHMESGKRNESGFVPVRDEKGRLGASSDESVSPETD